MKTSLINASNPNNKKPPLNKQDLNILYLLDVDGRASFSDIGRKTRMSKQRVAYRVERLEREGYIKGYYTLIDTSKLGYITFRIYLKLKTISPSQRKELIDSLAGMKQIWALYTFTGRYDLAIGLSVKELQEFYTVWEKILSTHLPEIKDYAIALYSPVYHYTKSYLIGKKDNMPARVLGGQKQESFDDTDYKILSILATNARIPLIDMASKVSLTPEAVSSRIKQLRAKGIIQGFRAMIDVHKLGYEYYKADIRLRRYDKIKEIQYFCAEHPNIYQFDKTIGGETLEIEFNVRNLQELIAIIDEMEASFPGVLESFEYLTIVEELKTTYLPQ